MDIVKIVSVVLMSILIVVEVLSILAHVGMSAKKKKKIIKNTELTKEIRDDLASYLAGKDDIARHDSQLDEIMKRLDAISAELAKKKN